MGVPDDRCALLAGEQYGCLSLAQALRCGLSRDAVFRRVRTGKWRRILPRVYVIAGTPTSWEQRLFAAVLWGGDEEVAVGGASAAALWGYPGFRRDRVELVHPYKRTLHGIYARRSILDVCDVTRLGIFPVTTPARTLVDLSPKIGRSRFDVLFHHCLHHRLATWEELRSLTTRLFGSRGTAKLRDALDAYAPGGEAAAASPLEARLARRLRRARLPSPVRQHPVDLPSGRRFLDFAWPQHLVAVEVDGYRWHSSRTAWESDRARLGELLRAGWTVIHATYEDVGPGFHELARELRAARSVQ